MKVSLEDLFILKPTISSPNEPIYVYTNGIRHIRSVLFNEQSLTLSIPLQLIRISDNPNGRSFFRANIDQIILLKKVVAVIETSLGTTLSKGFYINESTKSLFVNMQSIDDYMFTTVHTNGGDELYAHDWSSLKDCPCIALVNIVGIRFDTSKSTAKLVTELIDIEVDPYEISNYCDDNNYMYTMKVCTLLDCIPIDNYIRQKLLEKEPQDITINRLLMYCDTINIKYLLSGMFNTNDLVLLENSYEGTEDLIKVDPWGPGYVYLVTPAKYDQTKVFKVGMTQENPMNLKKRYRADCYFHVIIPTNSARNTETILLRLFTSKYERLWGREYFHGNLSCMVYDMIKICGCFQRTI